MYQILFSPQAKKDSKKVASSGLKPKVQELLALIEKEPLVNGIGGQVTTTTQPKINSSNFYLSFVIIIKINCRRV